MSEMFEKVNTHADAARQTAQKRKAESLRCKRADRRLRAVILGCFVVWVLMIVLSACGQISKGLADFVNSWAFFFLAIWVGAWIQFRFCRKGMME